MKHVHLLVSRNLGFFLLGLLFALLLPGCAPVQAGQDATPTLNPNATIIPCDCAEKRYATATPLPGPHRSQLTPTPPANTLWLPDYLPQPLRDALERPETAALATSEATASARLVVLDGPPAAGQPATAWVYVLAAPFPTVTDDIPLDDLRAAWSSAPAADAPLTTLLVDPATQAVLEQAWGKPGKGVRSLAAAQLLDTAWKERTAWAILPFEELEPRWKVISLDGQSPVRKDFTTETYGLTIYFGMEGTTPPGLSLPPGNRQPDQLTTVMLTGVTALVRGTASLMETRGMTYPSSDIGPWLREADLLHINNEVPFARNCPQPYNWEGLVFCSQPEYLALLEDVGADVIELSGDHFQDWGPEAMLYTLDLYQERGWPTYGGGANAQAAAQPAKFEHNGNKIAFLGCNGKPPGYATASAKTPGALHCDMEAMVKQVERLVEEGYLPIFTFQHLEYYQYIAHPLLQADFQRIAQAGAVIVSGSQAHQPHAFEIEPGSFLHYGLGNLFFDQTNQGDPPRTAFIDRHVIYGGRHISTELLTIYFVDYARARPMTPEERAALLATVFEASGW